MGFAAAEIRLQLDHRVAALAVQTLDRTSQQALEAFRQIRAAEELDRLAVFVRALADMHLPEVSRELRLLVAPARNVWMRAHHLPPGLERAGCLWLDGAARALA